MPTRARIITGKSSTAFSFDLVWCRFPTGIPRYARLITETLTADGVDGQLIVNKQNMFEPFAIEGICEFSSIAQAQQAFDIARRAQGQFATVIIDASVYGIERRWNKAHLTAFSGSVYRSTISSGSVGAQLRGQWGIQTISQPGGDT